MTSSLDRIAFKPLNGSPVDSSDEEDDQLDEANYEDMTTRFYPRFEQFTMMPGWFCHNHKYPEGNHCSSKLSLVMYMTIFILVLILIRHENHTKIENLKDNVTSTPVDHNKLHLESQAGLEHQLLEYGSYTPTIGPYIHRQLDQSSVNVDWSHYESYLSSVLRERNLRNSQADDLMDSHHGKKPWWSFLPRNGFMTVINYIRANKSFNYNSSITLTTQASTNFLHHTVELCKRWDGPISVAIFSPGEALKNAVTLIKFMRMCLPAPINACIRDKVTWHFVYNEQQGPSMSELKYPEAYLDRENQPLFSNHDQCPKFLGPDPIDLVKQFEAQLQTTNHPPSTLYPINILRNTARLAATTRYVLASDIELYPSIDLVPKFINFVSNHNVRAEHKSDKYVFTLPIFEVKANCSPPKTKSDLLKMIVKGDAIFFHKYVCDACQNFPNRLEWIKEHENDEKSPIFIATKRVRSRNSWEPIFIGTNEDPLYDERMSWDGRRDKMSQMYEMCLQDYTLLVLRDAFLVHAPGIKHIVESDQKKRLQFIRKNNRIYDSAIANLKQKYSTKETINIC